QEAADAYRQVLAQEPNQFIIMINLGAAESELGRDLEAEALSRQGLSRLEEIGNTTGLTPEDSMRKAHCLARLGRLREAVELAQAVLRKAPDDPALLQQSALVHSLAGDRTSAINNAADALDKGLHPRWFTGSAFRELRESPELSPRFPSPAEAAAAEEEAH
ncbi:MAG TPA: hypothetical protein VL025_05375, partial [Thermoanaerobaculia bacterium]|nr:hypothetical protein [Thermoanaerobaculia bacterium]